MFLYLHKPSLRDTLIVLAWFVASDFVDYAPIAPGRDGYGWYPPLPLGDELVPPMMAHAIVMTWLLNGILLVRVIVSKVKARRANPSRQYGGWGTIDDETVAVPLRRFELRPSAPGAGTLSIEL